MGETRRDRPLVVAGVDGSVFSSGVLQEAEKQAKLLDADLRVVLAWRFPELPGYVPPRAESELSSHAEKLVDDLVEKTFGPRRTDIEVVVQEASPVALLLQECKDADALVLGRRGLGHEDSKQLGSVTSACVAHATCPVIVVPV